MRPCQPADARHFLPHQVVREQHAPGLLLDGRYALAAQRFALFEQLRFQIVIAQFDFPTLVTDLEQVFGGIRFIVEKRGQESLWSEPLSRIEEATKQHGVRQLGMLRAGLMHSGSVDRLARCGRRKTLVRGALADS